MEEEKPKFAMTMAKIFIQQQTQKPFFGKPYIMAGAYWGACGFLFQQCGLIGRLYSDEEDTTSFMRVFAAQTGKESTALEYLDSRVTEEILPLVDEASSFQDLVAFRERARVNSSDNLANFFLKHGQEKLPQSQSAMLAAEWASYGGCVGLNYPDVIEDLFEASYRPNPRWEEAYKLGVVSTPKQTVLSIEDAEKEASGMFKEYCEQFYPELLPTLF